MRFRSIVKMSHVEQWVNDDIFFKNLYYMKVKVSGIQYIIQIVLTFTGNKPTNTHMKHQQAEIKRVWNRGNRCGLLPFGGHQHRNSEWTGPLLVDNGDRQNLNECVEESILEK